ncbi:hypothetical protein ACVMDN_003373 [Bradyrhizobium sp. USDA 4510]
MSDDPPLQLKPRLAIPIDQAQAIIDRIAPGARVAGITELRGGEISTILQITRADAPSCILKVYPAQLQWKMAKEVYVLGLLRDAGIAIPRILIADDSRALIDFNFVLMSKLDGVVLGNREAAPTDQELFSIYAAMGRALRRINGITLDSFGYIGPHGVWTSYPTNRAYMSAQFARAPDGRLVGARGHNSFGQSRPPKPLDQQLRVWVPAPGDHCGNCKGGIELKQERRRLARLRVASEMSERGRETTVGQRIGGILAPAFIRCGNGLVKAAKLDEGHPHPNKRDG